VEKNSVIVYTDKTVIKVHGLQIHGLNTRQLEEVLMERFQSIVRVIGVTGTSIDMDVYGIDPAQIQKDEKGLIRVLSTIDGVSPSEVARLASAERITEADINKIPHRSSDYCAKERWMNHD